MKSNFKYSVITGSMGQLADRFIPAGYSGPISYAEIMDGLGALGDVLDGIEVCHGVDIPEKRDPEVVKSYLKKYNWIPTYSDTGVSAETRFGKGSLTSTDPEIRKQAIELVHEAMDYAAAIGCPGVNLWLGEDGFDYPMCTDYQKQWNYLIEGMRECADYRPEIELTLEGKAREPRNFSLTDTTSSGLLACLEIDRKNVGLTIDIGHVLQCGQNIAQNIELACKYGKLFNLHTNDNYGSWDDDMIVGSVRYTELIEMFYSLRKCGYNRGIAVDIFPFRDKHFEATRESVEMMKKMDQMVDLIGFDKITQLREAGESTDMVKAVREAIFK